MVAKRSITLFISDVEFDSGYGSYYNHFNGGSNVFDLMHNKFTAAGYKLPKLVFWNVASRTNTIPCRYNDNGVLLVSGFSVNVLNQVLNGETHSFISLTKELDSARYEAIPKIVFTKAAAKLVKRTSKTKVVEKPAWLNN